MRHAPTTQYHLLAGLAIESTARDRQDAWAEFVLLYEPAIFGFVRRLGVQSADAAEIVQEVFIQVHRSARLEQLPVQDFRPWLAKVTRNRVIDLLRKKERYTKYLKSYASETPAQYDEAYSSVWQMEVRQQLFRQAAKQVRSEFQEIHWSAFWLTAIEQQSPASVAQKLQMSVGNVYVTKCRVMERIRTIVKEISFENIDLEERIERDAANVDAQTNHKESDGGKTW